MFKGVVIAAAFDLPKVNNLKFLKFKIFKPKCMYTNE